MLAAVGFGLLLGLVVFETGLRIVGYSSPKPYIPDEQLGYALWPGVSGKYNKEGVAWFTINSAGFRDVEHEIAKPGGTYRIAVVGDSYVEAFQVEHDEMFTNFIRQRVSECGRFGEKKVEVLSFGVSGYSTAQELVLLREKVLKYSPDLVVLLFTTNNDVTDNSPTFKKINIPYFTLNGNELVLDESFRQKKGFAAQNSSVSIAWKWLYNHIRVFQAIGDGSRALSQAYRSWKARQREQAVQERPPAALTSEDIGIDNQIYREPADERWADAWRLTERLLLEFRDELSRNGIEFLFVIGSNGVQTLPDRTATDAYARRLGAKDLFYPDDRLTGFAHGHGIDVLSLAPELQKYAEQNKVFLHGVDGNLGYGHWNKLGHEVAGRMIGGHICKTPEN